jgi:beta-galactosidase
MPDGSKRPEPGAPSWSIRLNASSEETSKGNVAELACDGDPSTRWCASGDGLAQWLSLDLEGDMQLSGIEVDWEFTDLDYEYAVESSRDGQEWVPLASGRSSGAPWRLKLARGARLLRIRPLKLPEGKWASIREIRLFDRKGEAVVNRRMEGGSTPADPGFDDSGWRPLDVPHDWGVEGPFRDDLPGDTGKLPWQAIGWYRKHFVLPESDRGKRVFLDLDGAMANARVYLNGKEVGGWPYGYQPFRVELTQAARFGAENVLAVRLDTVHWGSRWYPGAGIYRNTWLVTTSPVHVAQNGVKVTTPLLGDRQAFVEVTAEIQNQSGGQVEPEVECDVFEVVPSGTSGRIVASQARTRMPAAVPEGETLLAVVRLTVPNPVRWELSSPRLYLARIRVFQGASLADQYDQPFGLRTIEFTARDGFKLNGKRVPIRGTCNHHDLGPLGAALNVRALERQLEILKEMGCNALRTSHNPPAPELLELADRMGFLVMVEAFDCWRRGKTAYDYSRFFDAWHTRDLQTMVRRERNHPSVVLWSIGNEIFEQNGPDLARHLRDIVHAQDPTRPVTAGCNNANAGINGFQTAVDVFGLNYHLESYRRILDHPGNEHKPVHTSESSSCVSSRGEYFFPVQRGRPSQANFQVSSYDVDAPPWAQPPDEVFEALDRNPAFFGEFVWTGFDYLGEPTPYNSDVTNLLNFSDPEKRAAMQKELESLGRLRVPSASSYFGIVDLCGFKKDRFYLYQARWRPDLPMAHILPHWNWLERAGQVTPVHVYTSGEEAELFLDGRSLGRKKRGPYDYRLRWDDVVYQPGALEVVAYRQDKEWARDRVKTTGPPTQLLLQVDRPEIRADGRDLAFITVRAADGEGLTVPRSHNLVEFQVDGPGEIVAVGDGDAASHEPFQASRRSVFNGLCLVIVKARVGKPGAITLRAHSTGLKDADILVKSR